MSKVIEAAALTAFDVTADGGRVQIHVRDVADQPGTLSLPFETLAQLMMTMPRMAREAFRARFSDESLRIVYPIGNWKIESCAQPGKLILTLTTSDGFEISFALDGSDCAALTDGLAQAPAAAPRVPLH
jgi:hypothetical protein